MKSRSSTLIVLLTALAWSATGAAAEHELPPSPFAILDPRAATPPLLDAAPPCIPGVARSAFEPAVKRALGGDLGGARQAFAAFVEDPEADADTVHDARLALVLLAARTAADPLAARAEIDIALTEHPAAVARACARLEQTRLALRLRRPHEALASLGRAEREVEGAELPPALRVAADFYRAEAEILDERRDAARNSYLTLRDAADPRLAIAAKLRLADLATGWPVPVTDAEAASRWKTYQELLVAARGRNLDVVTWSARAGEIALAAGQLAASHRWLASAERLENRSGVASIRKADVLVALGRPLDARNALERVAEGSSLRAARELAKVRLAAYGLGEETLEQRVAQLNRGAAAFHPHVAALARYELARVLLDAGEVDGSLDALARLAHSGTPAHDQPDIQTLFDRAMREAARADVPCPRLLERLGGRRNLFIGLSGDSEPIARLGDCFVELGMPHQGVDVYRHIVRRFGVESEEGLPLRIARASLAAGDLPILRATLRAQLASQKRRKADETPTDLDAHWQWLRARLDLLDGEVADAASAFDALARRDDLDAELRVSVELALAELEPSALDSERLAITLASSLARPLRKTAGRGWNESADVPKGSGSERGPAWLRLADLQRAQGRTTIARAAYIRAAEVLPDGARRQRARYAAAVLATSPNATQRSLQRNAASADSSAWSRLADAEQRLIALRTAVHGDETSR